MSEGRSHSVGGHGENMSEGRSRSVGGHGEHMSEGRSRSVGGHGEHMSPASPSRRITESFKEFLLSPTLEPEKRLKGRFNTVPSFLLKRTG